MLLSVFTRHSTGCKFSRDRACRRCNCPKWVGGQINGYYFRQSAKTRQWAEAEAARQQLEEALAKGLPPFGTAVADTDSTLRETAAPPIPPTPSTETPAVPSHETRPKPRPRVTVAQAVEAYLADAVSRSVEASTLKKLETIFRKQFLAWTRVQGFEYLDELDLDALLNFRNTWEDGPLAKQKKQSRVIGFFWACVRRRYLTENPAIGLGKIKVVQVPTDYFPPEEFERILAATYIRRGERGGGDVKANQARLRTMTLLMRWRATRFVWREASLSAVRDISWASRSARQSPEAHESNLMFDPDAHLPRINRGMIYLGACLIAGIRLARERQVNIRVVPTRQAIEESVDLAHEIFNRVFRKVPEKVKEIH